MFGLIKPWFLVGVVLVGVVGPMILLKLPTWRIIPKGYNPSETHLFSTIPWDFNSILVAKKSDPTWIMANQPTPWK